MLISDWSSDVCSSDRNVVQRRCPSKVSAVQPAGYWEVSGAASGPPLERSRRFFVACKVRLMPALLPEEETMTKTVADFMLECLAADPAAPHHQEPGEELCQGAPEGRSGSARHRLARSEERRVGKECGRTCRSRWSPDH